VYEKHTLVDWIEIVYVVFNAALTKYIIINHMSISNKCQDKI